MKTSPIFPTELLQSFHPNLIVSLYSSNMLEAILVVLVILFLLGYVHIQGLTIPDFYLFTINGHQITLIELLIFLVIIGAAEVLPSPLRQIAFVVILLWLLSTLGIIAVAGLSGILVLAIIIGLILSLLKVV